MGFSNVVFLLFAHVFVGVCSLRPELYNSSTCYG